MTDILAHLFKHMQDHFPPASAPAPVSQAGSPFLPAAAAAQPTNPNSCGGGNSSPEALL